MEKTRTDNASLTYKAAYYLMNGCLAVVPNFDVSCGGTENLPAADPFVLAMTHHNSWDAPAAGYSVYKHLRRPINFMVYEDFLDGTNSVLTKRFKNLGARIIGGALANMHALAVQRKENLGENEHLKHEHIRAMRKVLLKNGILGIFVEGERRNTTEVSNVKSGAGFFACRNNVAVIPAAIVGENFGEIGSAKAYIPRPLHIHFGSKLHPAGKTKQDIDSINQQLTASLQQTRELAALGYKELYGHDV